MPLEMPRRRFLQVLTGIIAAPAVIKAERLMRVAAAPDRVLYRETYLRPMLAGEMPLIEHDGPFIIRHYFYDGSIRGWIPPVWREIVPLCCDIDTTPTQAQTASAERDLPILRAASGRDIEPTA